MQVCAGQHAYFTLSDPERRERYDSNGIEGDPTALTGAQLARSIISILTIQFTGGNKDLF